MTLHATKPPTPVSTRTRIPPLEPGDRLTRDEFERRYAAMPELKKAELIEGVVYMAPPAVRWDYHGTPHARMITWLGVYESATPGVCITDNASIRLDTDSIPQPDAAMIIEPSAGGQAKRTDDGYVEGGPELVVEIAGSSVSIDLNDKLHVYRRNGVREYIVWRVYDEVIDYLALKGGTYIPLPADNGVIRSEVFPGLWLDAPALLRGDLATVLRVLQEGIATSAHAEFVKRLESNVHDK